MLKNRQLLTDFGDFWRVASGEVAAYNAAIDTVIPSVVSLTEAQDALTASIDANIGDHANCD